MSRLSKIDYEISQKLNEVILKEEFYGRNLLANYAMEGITAYHNFKDLLYKMYLNRVERIKKLIDYLGLMSGFVVDLQSVSGKLEVAENFMEIIELTRRKLTEERTFLLSVQSEVIAKEDTQTQGLLLGFMENVSKEIKLFEDFLMIIDQMEMSIALSHFETNIKKMSRDLFV